MNTSANLQIVTSARISAVILRHSAADSQMLASSQAVADDPVPPTKSAQEVVSGGILNLRCRIGQGSLKDKETANHRTE